jgi:hypothetical protein
VAVADTAEHLRHVGGHHSYQCGFRRRHRGRDPSVRAGVHSRIRRGHGSRAVALCNTGQSAVDGCASRHRRDRSRRPQRARLQGEHFR